MVLFWKCYTTLKKIAKGVRSKSLLLMFWQRRLAGHQQACYFFLWNIGKSYLRKLQVFIWTKKDKKTTLTYKQKYTLTCYMIFAYHEWLFKSVSSSNNKKIQSILFDLYTFKISLLHSIIVMICQKATAICLCLIA